MNDPWDVKSVKSSKLYQSHMKINGVPLLPPVISKECRKEMQYYKLLAKEVEKRIKHLKPYVADPDFADEKAIEPRKSLDSALVSHAQEVEPYSPTDNHSDSQMINSNVIIDTDEVDPSANMMINLNVCINNKSPYFSNACKKPKSPNDLPERDCDSPKKIECNPTSILGTKQMKPIDAYKIDRTEKKHQDNTLGLTHTAIGDGECNKSQTSSDFRLESPQRFSGDANLSKNKHATNTESYIIQKPYSPKGLRKLEEINISQDLSKNYLGDLNDLTITSDEPCSLSSGSKTFTGSLQNIAAEFKNDKVAATLVRQSSYTVLTPSPLLMAHLHEQAENTGVDVNSISMSESVSDISMSKKRRRSWDLETAKNQWSSMAQELQKYTRPGVNHKAPSKHCKSPKVSTPATHPLQSVEKSKPVPTKYASNKPYPKSDPIQKANTASSAKKPETNNLREHQSHQAYKAINGVVPKTPTKEQTAPEFDRLISGSEDPAAKVRELYEKVQKQQYQQMTMLIEKQKKEQMLLQKVFEEQNNMLFRQLKTICPTASLEIKHAWVDKEDAADNRGPVSLNQLLDQSPPPAAPASPTPKAAPRAPTNNSKNVTTNKRNPTENKKQTNSKRLVSRTANKSPTPKNASRKLNYDNMNSTPREEPVLSDRTNDTFADLNVTFNTDYSDIQLSSGKSSPRQRSPLLGRRGRSPCNRCTDAAKSTDAAITNLQSSIQKTMNAVTNLARPTQQASSPARPSPQTRAPQEIEAASKIVAYAKGYLVRRLMRTERIQATVATIRDALLCALQLHQDRQGIRGADVDLHRRLIQQITAACYTLHDAFIASSPAERCAAIAIDRLRKKSPRPRPRTGTAKVTKTECANRPNPNTTTVVFTHFNRRTSTASISTQSHSLNETFDVRGRFRRGESPPRRPWR